MKGQISLTCLALGGLFFMSVFAEPRGRGRTASKAAEELDDAAAQKKDVEQRKGRC